MPTIFSIVSSSANPAASAVPGQVAPIVLSAAGLVIVMILAMVAIVAIVIRKPKLLYLRRPYKLTGALILIWIATAWLGAHYYYSHVDDNFYQYELKSAAQQAENIASNIDHSLHTLQGIPFVVAHARETLQALHNFGANQVHTAPSGRQRKLQWARDQRLTEINAYLNMMAVNLESDVVWIVNTDGDCIASSNAGQSVSFVGTNYADRDYFHQAKAGHAGRQYAMGRESGIPGLYYSAPIIENGKFLGAAVVKRNITNLTFWTNQSNVFFADANGVIVLAKDQNLEFLSIPHAPIVKLTTEQRLQKYKRGNFSQLSITSWKNPQFPEALFIGKSTIPVVLASHMVAEAAITIYLFRPLSELARYGTEQGWLFFLLASSGSMLILAISAIVFYLRESRKMDANLRIAAATFEAQQSMFITDANNVIMRVNRAFTDTTGYSATEAIGKTPQMLKSGRHDAVFYRKLWAGIQSTGYWHGEIWNRTKSGEIHPEMLTISAVRDAQGTTQQYVALFSDITALKEHEKQLEHIAHYDALTQLPNRVLLADRMHSAMVQNRQCGQQMMVVYLDLDGFKAINDKHGHQAGDQLLITLAASMKLALREGDTLARIGGDEFVAVLPDLNNVAASTPILSRLLAAACKPAQVGDLVLQTSASGGVTTYPQLEEVDADQLLRQADQAMYQAKLAGKNRYHLFDSKQDRTIRDHNENVKRIRHALAESEFVLHYQPKVNMRTGALIGAEALIRWQHPQQGLLLPGLFLPSIENHAIAIELGEWVAEAALTQMAQWQSAGLYIPVSINVSASQLQQDNFVERLREILARHPSVNPGDLELEILETSALEDLDKISAVMEDCRKLGVMFALDDFGTGYSSLTYLKRLPVTLLKIDRSFVRDMLDDQDDLAILGGVIGLANAFHRKVIAEGVETAEHGEMLLQLGCELGQGFGIARPMHAQDMRAWLDAWQPDPIWINLPAVSRSNQPLLLASVEHRASIIAIKNAIRDETGGILQLNYHHTHFDAWYASEGLLHHASQPSVHAIKLLHKQLSKLTAELDNELNQLHSDEQSSSTEQLCQLRKLGDELLKQMNTLVRKIGSRPKHTTENVTQSAA